jgi:hypothetical protein
MPAETRIKRELKFNAEGEDGTLPRTFSLAQWDTPQKRDGRAADGWIGTASATVITLAEGITRAGLVSLITEAADWLAWDGTNG